MDVEATSHEHSITVKYYERTNLADEALVISNANGAVHVSGVAAISELMSLLALAVRL